MGNRNSGARPKPRQLKQLSGTLRGDRDKGAALPVRGGSIRCPAGTSEPVAIVFKRLVRELKASGILKPIDAELLLQLATAIHMNHDAATHLATDGAVYNDPAHGNRPTKSPYYQIWKESGATVRSLSAHFGLSPADRERLNMPEEKNTLTDLVNGLSYDEFKESKRGRK